MKIGSATHWVVDRQVEDRPRTTHYALRSLALVCVTIGK